MKNTKINKKIGYFVFLFLSFSSFSAVPAERSLCNSNEDVIFDCRLSDKQLSLCGSSGFVRKGGSLTYRYGKQNKIELTFPSTQRNSNTQFFSSNTSYSGGSEERIRFNNGGWDYILYNRMVRTRFDGESNEPDFTAGLAVHKDGKVSAKKCSNDAQIDFAAFKFMSKEGFDDRFDLP